MNLQAAHDLYKAQKELAAALYIRPKLLRAAKKKASLAP